MTTGKTTKPASKPFNAASYLRNEESLAEFIMAMLEDGDERLIPSTLRTVADAIGMSELARRTGLDRSNLYAALSEDGNPRLDTVRGCARLWAEGHTGGGITVAKGRQAADPRTRLTAESPLNAGFFEAAVLLTVYAGLRGKRPQYVLWIIVDRAQ